MVYAVIENDQTINTIEIDPANVEQYEQLTGWTLEPMPTPGPDPEPEIDWAEEYVNLAAQVAARELGLEA